MENEIIAMFVQTYMKEILDCFGMTEATSVVCLMDVNIHAQKAENALSGIGWK